MYDMSDPVVLRVLARQAARYLSSINPPLLQAERICTVDTCGRFNRFGHVNKEIKVEENGDVLVTMDTIAHCQMWVFSASGELVTAMTYVDFGTDVPATRKVSALEHRGQRHTA